ncbi:histidine phosphatase family protein [Aeromicrobium sp. CTD01-1L150]|uniref:histidine phosphatase family protein n=1 Tax=Aeromicrobium sp. CTD01-1L150 TaxID=3341830 RepID=UPI0035C0D2B2
MSTTLHLVRHGETVWHAENRYAGSSDVALTDRGHQQARRLAQWARDERPRSVHSSTLGRAALTAQPSAEALGLDVTQHDALREVDFGRGEGMTRAEMAGTFPDELERFLARPAENPLPDGESGLTALDRAWPLLLQLAADAEGSVLVVMHSTLLRLVLCRALDLDPNRYRSVFPTVHNVAPTTVRLHDDGAALLAFNQTL